MISSLGRRAIAALGGIALTCAPVVAGAAPTHIPTLVFLNSTGKIYSFGTDWSTIAPYLTYAIVDDRAANQVAAVGIKTGFYSTMHTICEPRSYGECQPAASTVPEEAFVHSCDGRNARVSANPPASASNPHPLVQYIGNVESPVLAREWNKLIDGHLHNRFGDFHYDFVFEDNAGIPSESLSWLRFYDAQTGAVLKDQPYCGFNAQAYIAAQRRLDSEAHLPVLMNAFGITDRKPLASTGVQYMTHSPNVIGGMLEYAFGSTINGPSRRKDGGKEWQSEENTELNVVRTEKLFLAYPHNGGGTADDIDVRGYQYASLLLGSDGSHISIAEDGEQNASHFPLNPEVGLVAERPLVKNIRSTGQMRMAGGAYAREFAACSIWGKNVGPCAAVVNPNEHAAVRFPQLQRRYAHSLVLQGSGIIPHVDNGYIGVGGPSPADEIPPKGWNIVFR